MANTGFLTMSHRALTLHPPERWQSANGPGIAGPLGVNEMLYLMTGLGWKADIK